MRTQGKSVAKRATPRYRRSAESPASIPRRETRPPSGQATCAEDEVSKADGQDPRVVSRDDLALDLERRHAREERLPREAPGGRRGDDDSVWPLLFAHLPI
jgi:hypothetical protein